MVSLWIVPTTGDPKPVAIVQPPSSQSNIYSYRVSPDSRWVAYSSDESGQTEIYLTSFPEGKGKWKVSAGSGAFPAWSANAREVFYESISQDFYACTVTVKGAEIEVGAPQHLFNSQTPGIGVGFDVCPRWPAAAGEPRAGRSPGPAATDHELAGGVEEIDSGLVSSDRLLHGQVSRILWRWPIGFV